MGRINRLKVLRDNLSGPRPKPIWSEVFFHSYKNGEHLSPLERLGLSLGNVFRAMPAVILSEELLVGGNHLLQIAGFSPEGSIYLDENLAESIRVENPDPDSQQLIDEVLQYFHGKTTRDLIQAEWSPSDFAMQGYNVYQAGLTGGDALLDYEKILNIGIDGLIGEIKSHLKTAQATEYYDPNDFYRGILCVCDGIKAFARHHSIEAKHLADVTLDPIRKQELLQIAGVCEKVPASGAETFQEALQSFWFIHLLGGGGSPGRIDQYLEPYYRNSLEQDEITQESSQEFLDSLWIKMNEVKTRFLCLGGVRPNGEDGANSLSFQCLESQRRIHLDSPKLVVRLNNQTPPEFLQASCKFLRTGGGLPIFCNDEVIIPALIQRGIPLEDARDYSLAGDGLIEIQGKSQTEPSDGKLNLLKCLEITLHNGRDPYNRTHLGPQTGDVRYIDEFEELLESYKRQVEFFCGKMIRSANASQRIRARQSPNLFRSLFLRDCIHRGIDYQSGGTLYNPGQILIQGFANAVDSLYAIKKLVFEDHSLSMTRLLEALSANYSYEKYLQHYLASKIVKFGNDDFDVDSLAVFILNQCLHEVQRHLTWRGGSYSAGIFTTEDMAAFADHVRATPDGREGGSYLASSLGSCPGMDKSGLDSLMKSVQKLHHKETFSSLSLNLKINPSSVSEDIGLRKLMRLVLDYFKNGGRQLQINVIDPEILNSAQKHPNAFQSLLVDGSLFAKMSSQQQLEIQARTEYFL